MWLVSQAAVQGRGHERNDIPCQDKVLSAIEDDFVFGGLADGAGSARLSHYGAAAALSFSRSYFANNFDAIVADTDGVNVKRKFMSGLLHALDDECEVRQCRRADLASTLLLVAIKNDKVILMHIGDGLIGYRKNGEVLIATKPSKGEFANQTVFTTSESATKAMQLIKTTLSDIDAFVLMSDGTEASCYDKRHHCVAKAIGHLLIEQTKRPSGAFTKLLEEAVQNSLKPATVDDCSLVLMVKADKALTTYENLSETEKRQCLGLNDKGRSLRFERYNNIMLMLKEAGEEGLTLTTLSNQIGIKAKHLDGQLLPLVKKGVIIKKGKRVIRAVI